MSAPGSPTEDGRRDPEGGEAPVEGRLLIQLAWIGTGITCVTSVANAVTGDRRSYALSAAPALVLFVLGCGAFLWAFVVAVERSRTEEIGVGGLFFLAGCAPPRVQRSMLAAVVVQTTVPVIVALIRPFTAFAVLAPMWALGLAGLWGARHGTFPPRTDGVARGDGGPGAPGPRDAPD